MALVRVTKSQAESLGAALSKDVETLRAAINEVLASSVGQANVHELEGIALQLMELRCWPSWPSWPEATADAAEPC